MLVCIVVIHPQCYRVFHCVTIVNLSIFFTVYGLLDVFQVFAIMYNAAVINLRSPGTCVCRSKIAGLHCVFVFNFTMFGRQNNSTPKMSVF
jgi:hypothetical protein